MTFFSTVFDALTTLIFASVLLQPYAGMKNIPLAVLSFAKAASTNHVQSEYELGKAYLYPGSWLTGHPYINMVR